jgi:hypothetical protein
LSEAEQVSGVPQSLSALKKEKLGNLIIFIASRYPQKQIAPSAFPHPSLALDVRALQRYGQLAIVYYREHTQIHEVAPPIGKCGQLFWVICPQKIKSTAWMGAGPSTQERPSAVSILPF